MKKLEKHGKYWKNALRLISENTVSSRSNKECAAFVATELEGLGFHVHLHEYEDENGEFKQQVVAKIGPEVEDGIILCGHLDTVPFADQPGWSRDPLKLVEDDINLYGRGTSDMKLFTAACLEAFSLIDLTRLKKPIVCLFTADEEIGCAGADRIANDLQSILDKTPLPKAAIIGEPTSFKMINRHKGVGHFFINFKGKAWHSSRPDLGKNALLSMAKFVDLVQKMNLDYEKKMNKQLSIDFPDFFHNYLHVAQANGGLALNMVPDQVELGLSYRSFPSESGDMVFEDCKKVLESHFSSDDYSISKLTITPAMPKSNHNKLEKCIHSVCPHGEPQSVSFATDGGVLSRLGIQSYIWGPGLIEVAHRADEYMPIKDFLEAPLFLKQILENFLD